MRKTIAFIFLLCGAVANAQDKEQDLDPVTVTTSLTPEKNSQTGRNLFVIRGERLNSLPVHSIDELLRYLPGVEVQARGPLGAQSDIVLRGGTFQQVLVILDGVRLNDPNTGHFTSYIPIAPAEIDRIEILKGASSAIYGSEAVGGVIQIITKTFAARKGVAQSKLSAQVTGGQHDLFSADAGGSYSNGKTTVSGGVLSNNTSGQPQRGTHGSVYANTASASVSHFFGERWQVQLRTAYDDRRFTAQNFYTNFVSDTAVEHVSTFWNQLGVQYTGIKHHVSLTAGYKTLDDRYNFNSVSTPNKNRSKLLQALLTDEWKLGEQTTLVSGAQVVSKKITSNDRGNHEVDQAAAFLIVNRQWNNRFFLRPALRVEWNEISGWELVPQVNLSYRAARWQLRASGGKTIRDADFTERYNNYQKVFVSSGRIGNPDLEAERSFSYEGGADYFIGQQWKLSATFFQRYHSKLIDYVPTPYSQMPRQVNLSPTGSYALAKNISKVTTTGAEFEGQYSKTWSARRSLWATFGLTWLKSRSSEITPSFYISSHAKFLASYNVLYTAGRISASINGLYKKRQPQPVTAGIAKVTSDYWILNAKLEGFVIPHRLSIFVEADNLFDHSYADLLGAQMPGRWLMGGIKISLSK